MDIFQKIDKKIEDTKIGDATITIKEYEEIKKHISALERESLRFADKMHSLGFDYAAEQREQMEGLHNRTIGSLESNLNRKHLEEIEAKNNMIVLLSIFYAAFVFLVIVILKG